MRQNTLYPAMYKKNFISVSFFDNSIQIVELDSLKKKISKTALINIPPGIIERSKVLNPEALSKIISDCWAKYKFKEKSVAIVVPEFSTFNKLLKIPKLSIKELDEAVRWKAQEYLPAKNDDVVLDWKIVHESSTEYEILTVAIPHSNLVSFIDPLDKAGLYPLEVETPSLSLVRISGNDNLRKLIIYTGTQEIILTLAQGEKIIASSIVSTNLSVDLLINTCKQMVAHYASEKLDKIYFGSLNNNLELKNKLSTAFGYQLEDLRFADSQLEIKTSDKDQYLLPLSLQLTNPKEPSDEYSINLLPPKWVKKYDDKKRFKQFSTLTVISSLVIWTCFFASLIVYGLLANELARTKSESSKIQANAIPANLQQEILNINNISSKVIKIANLSISPQKIINEINNAKLPEITITQYHLDLEGMEISIAGKAANPSALVKFKHELEKNTDFTQVSLPLSDLQPQSNIDFNIGMYYKKIKPNSGKINLSK